MAGWMRLCTAIVDREGTAYMGEETKAMCVPGPRGQRLLLWKKRS